MKPFAAIAIVSLAASLPAAAQPAPTATRVFQLHYSGSQAEQNELLTALRNIMPVNTKVFLVPSRNQIVMTAPAADLQAAETLIRELDIPARVYRLTYTFTDMDNGKRIGQQSTSMVLVSKLRTQAKQGSRIPLVTGSLTDDKLTKSTTYLDVGINIDAQVEDHGNGGVELKSRVERSSLAEERSGIGPEDPVIRQTMLEGTTVLQEGKPTVLGSMDTLGSTRHLEVSATVEQIH